MTSLKKMWGLAQALKLHIHEDTRHIAQSHLDSGQAWMTQMLILLSDRNQITISNTHRKFLRLLLFKYWEDRYK